MFVARALTLLATLSLLAACAAPPRPPVRAIPTDTLKVNPELLKPAPTSPEAPQSK